MNNSSLAAKAAPPKTEKQKSLPIVGDSVKVHLPGESPWATCVAVLLDGRWLGRIDNYLFGQMSKDERRAAREKWFPGDSRPLPKLHDHKQNDLVLFELETTPDYQIWVPSILRAA